MISESQEEQACLYVFGLLPESEATAFEAEISRSTELSELVASLNNASLALARSAPQAELPPELRRRLMESVSAPSGNVIPLRVDNRFRFIPWAAAACLAGLLYWQSENANQQKTVLQKTVANRDAELTISSEKLSSLEAATAETLRQLAEKERQLAGQLAAAEVAKADLLARLAALEQKDFLAQTQIAVMNSLLKDRPQAVAVSLWNQERQNGVLVVENLPVLEEGKDYQLWVLDRSIAAPVSAGVFKVDAGGRVRITFRPNQAIATAGKFAVTKENEGGVLSPTMDQMVVIGGS